MAVKLYEPQPRDPLDETLTRPKGMAQRWSFSGRDMAMRRTQQENVRRVGKTAPASPYQTPRLGQVNLSQTVPRGTLDIGNTIRPVTPTSPAADLSKPPLPSLAPPGGFHPMREREYGGAVGGFAPYGPNLPGVRGSAGPAEIAGPPTEAPWQQGARYAREARQSAAIQQRQRQARGPRGAAPAAGPRLPAVQAAAAPAAAPRQPFRTTTGPAARQAGPMRVGRGPGQQRVPGINILPQIYATALMDVGATGGLGQAIRAEPEMRQQWREGGWAEWAAGTYRDPQTGQTAEEMQAQARAQFEAMDPSTQQYMLQTMPQMQGSLYGNPADYLRELARRGQVQPAQIQGRSGFFGRGMTGQARAAYQPPRFGGRRAGPRSLQIY